MKTPSELRRLHFIDALFARVTGHDLYLAEQIRAAITTSLEELDSRPPADPDFTAATAQLLSRLCEGQEDHGFHHWDVAEEPADATPLFTRARVVKAMKGLARFHESTLLITNLRPAHCPPRRRWTARRRREYDEALLFIREFAASRSRAHASVNILFL